MADAKVRTSEPKDLFGNDEIWKPTTVNEFYDVSSLGRIRSWRRVGYNAKRGTGRRARPRIITGGRQKYGHLGVALSHPKKPNERYYVHQLVAWVFLGPQPEDMPVIRHLNGIPSDNRPENLAYGTYDDNYQDFLRHNGGQHPNSPILTVSQQDVHDMEEAVKRTDAKSALTILSRFLNRMDEAA